MLCSTKRKCAGRLRTQYTTTDKGTTKTLNYFKVANKNVNRCIVDSPGYGYLGMAPRSGLKLIDMITKYAKESSR